MKEFKGRVIAPGTVKAEALVSHGGLNTLASFQGALQFGDKKATCGDQNNPDLYNKEMAGKALCLPQTIGSTTGGLVLYCACAMGRQPACMLFSKPLILWLLPVPFWLLCGSMASKCLWWIPWATSSWPMSSTA